MSLMASAMRSSEGKTTTSMRPLLRGIRGPREGRMRSIGAMRCTSGSNREKGEEAGAGAGGEDAEEGEEAEAEGEVGEQEADSANGWWRLFRTAPRLLRAAAVGMPMWPPLLLLRTAEKSRMMQRKDQRNSRMIGLRCGGGARREDGELRRAGPRLGTALPRAL